jgi:hypothetical protein
MEAMLRDPPSDLPHAFVASVVGELGTQPGRPLDGESDHQPPTGVPFDQRDDIIGSGEIAGTDANRVERAPTSHRD